ncbi:helix-turn-helix domain-containing protein [Bacillus sp. T3]|uniref:helix-turn-helix domain-containing protein n=1 Tax=Bacillus sp. T3 TaxID=467262 RepID=UPI003996A8EA
MVEISNKLQSSWPYQSAGSRYRLNKITDLLKQDLRNPQVSFQLLIALKALKIIDHQLFEK